MANGEDWPERDADLTRRSFLQVTAAGATVAVAARAAAEAQAPTATPAIDADPSVPGSRITLTVNGARVVVDVEDRWTLVELLRDRLGLTGTKIGCDRGECGACTVQLDGRPVSACSHLAVWADGRRVDTVEGLAVDGRPHPLQQAFMEHDAAQCGFCTSGQLMSARALLAANPHPTPDQVRAAMAGNLCRCANYNRYVESVLAAAEMLKAGGGGA